MGTGVAASFRPRKYYRVPKETLEIFLDDIEQLINFFVIEVQRILFAENVAVTVGVCFPSVSCQMRSPLGRLTNDVLP